MNIRSRYIGSTTTISSPLSNSSSSANIAHVIGTRTCVKPDRLIEVKSLSVMNVRLCAVNAALATFSPFARRVWRPIRPRPPPKVLIWFRQGWWKHVRFFIVVVVVVVIICVATTLHYCSNSEQTKMRKCETIRPRTRREPRLLVGVYERLFAPNRLKRRRFYFEEEEEEEYRKVLADDDDDDVLESSAVGGVDCVPVVVVSEAAEL